VRAFNEHLELNEIKEKQDMSDDEWLDDGEMDEVESLFVQYFVLFALPFHPFFCSNISLLKFQNEKITC
jgi:hypothetical protein